LSVGWFRVMQVLELFEETGLEGVVSEAGSG
jgi:hypothetical protein